VRASYRLRLPEGRPLRFERSHLSGDEPLQLIVQQKAPPPPDGTPRHDGRRRLVCEKDD
jgi:hypothetical protein